MQSVGCSTRREARRSRDSMCFTAGLRAPRNAVIRPNFALIKVFI